MMLADYFFKNIILLTGFYHKLYKTTPLSARRGNLEQF